MVSTGLGIGLGAFAQGFGNGINLRAQLDENKARRAAYDRETKNQADRDALNATSQKEFDAKVKTGEFQPDQLMSFMTKYKLPQMSALLMQQGDYVGAKSLNDWWQTDAAQEGTKLFGTAMVKAQAGDLSGAIDAGVQAAQVKGYLNHSLSLSKKEPLKAADGSITGYRIHLKDVKSGEDLAWDVTPDNVVEGIATLFNPEQAYKSIITAKQDRAKADLEVQTFGLKAGIEQSNKVKDDARKHRYDLDLLKEKQKAGDIGTPPADVATATWLAQKKAAAEGRAPTDNDMLEAYVQVRKAKDSPNGRAALVVRVYDSMAGDLNDDRSTEDKRAAARKFVDDLFTEENSAAAPGIKPPLPTPQDGAPAKPAGRSAPTAAQPLPAELAGEPDGTVVQDDNGNRFVIKGGQLVPAGQ